MQPSQGSGMDGRNIELKIFGLIAGMAAGMILLAG